LAELAASIKSTGLIQPIIVRVAGEQFELIAGERRWRAATLAGLTLIPAIIREVDGYAQAQMALVENIQREDLNPMDRARAYAALVAQLGLTQQELASRLGEDRSSIANHLRLLDLTSPVQSLVAAGSLSLGHAKVLAGIPAGNQERFAQLVINQELSVRNLERAVEAERTPQATPPPPVPLTGAAAHVPDLEQSLTRQLGLRVQLRPAGTKGKGRLIFHYSTLDEFDELMTRMGVRLES
jgi:ParB family chromosome partitioning protein